MQKYNYFIGQPHNGIALILENFPRVCSCLPIWPGLLCLPGRYVSNQNSYLFVHSHQSATLVCRNADLRSSCRGSVPGLLLN